MHRNWREGFPEWVSRGAALLDEKRPGWYELVDEKELRDKPLLAQLFGPGRSTSGLLGLLSDRPERRERYRGGDGAWKWRTREAILIAPFYGFVAQARQTEPRLRSLWREEIERRKADG